MEQSGIHISPRISGGQHTPVIRPVCLEDAYGPLNIYLIPYIHPSVVREAYPEEKITDWTQAMDVLIRNAQVDPAARNIAVCHQYVTASGTRPEECDSEQKHIGGLDNVDYSVFDAFDYVALGHLHGPQRIGRDTVRYAGSPLKYSFSEEKHKKSVTLLEIKEKGHVEYSLLPLAAARDFKTLRGTFSTLMSPGFTASLSAEDYYRIILTDEQDIDQALARLRRFFYKNLMDLEYDNTRTRTRSDIDAGEETLEKEPIEILQELFLKQNGSAMNEYQTQLASRLIEEIWREDL
jgi:exonuclease SbcD